MQLYQLEQFCTVARCEHMTSAARQLRISQPALSQSIARLEEELQVVLFERKGRQIKLNYMGREFLAYAESALRQLNEGRTLLMDMQRGANGRIRMADMICPLFSRAILRQYLQRNPNTAIEYMAFQGRDMKPLLLSGEADLLLTVIPPNQKEYNWLPLGHMQMELFLPCQYSEQEEGNTIDLKNCQDMLFVGADHRTMMRRILESICDAEGFFPKFTFESNDWLMMVDLAAHYQGGLYYLNSQEHPLPLIEHPSLHKGYMASRVISNNYIHPIWGAVTLKGHYLSPSAKSFLNFLQETFCAPSDSPEASALTYPQHGIQWIPRDEEL